jgi:hypothetical protein
MTHVNLRESLTSELRAIDDWRMTYRDKIALYERIGFEVLITDVIPTAEGRADDEFSVLWHPAGILATCESYLGGDIVNSSKIYYNLRFAPLRGHSDLLASGCVRGPKDDPVWVGDHDVREGLADKIASLAEVTDFLPVWVERGYLWLVTYNEKGDHLKDWEARHQWFAGVTAARVARLPEHVRTAIAGEAS